MYAPPEGSGSEQTAERTTLTYQVVGRHHFGVREHVSLHIVAHQVVGVQVGPPQPYAVWRGDVARQVVRRRSEDCIRKHT